MAGTIVQSVAASANGATGVTVNIASTTAGNLLLLATVMTNNTSVLATAFTGTTQTVTALEHPTGTGSQGQMWYVPNCASGTTAVTFSRPTGTGQFSGLVVEVSGEATSTPLDQHTSTGSQALAANGNPVTTGTTGTTTQATEFWYAVFPEKNGNATNNGAPTFSALLAGWTQDQTSGSTAATGNTNVAIFGAWKTVSSTGTANATITVNIDPAATGSTNDGMGIVATFLDAGGVVGIPPGLGPVVSMQEPALTADLSAMMR